MGERHGRSGRARQPVPAPAVRPGVRGDGVRAQRDRIGEPLGRRQRPVHPRRGRRRPEHGEDPGRDPEPHRGRAPGRGRASCSSRSSARCRGSTTRRRRRSSRRSRASARSSRTLPAGLGAAAVERRSAAPRYPDVPGLLSEFSPQTDPRGRRGRSGFRRRRPSSSPRSAMREAATDAHDDPQAPARLRRRRRPAAGRARGDRLHRREPAAADPGVRGEAVRAQGRVPDRPGRRPGAGPDDPRRRRPRRRRHRRRGGERRRRRHVRDRPRVPADLPGRDGADAPDDRAQGHVLRARPGDGQGRRVRRGRHDPGREHGAGRQPRRDPVGARLRHAGVPEAAAGRRRQGPRRPRRGPRQAARLGRADQQATWRSSTPRSRSARRTSPG